MNFVFEDCLIFETPERGKNVKKKIFFNFLKNLNFFKIDEKCFFFNNN